MKQRWRKLIASIGVAAMGTTLLAPMNVPMQAKAAQEKVFSDISEEGREISFNKGWKFFLETEGRVDASGKEFDDSAWRNVDLPHDYSIEQPFDPNSPGTANGGYLNGGTGWYRKTFVLPKSMEGKKISIAFGGIYMDSTTYVNGKMIGNYPYGYSPFAYDITDNVVADGVTENVISIRVNNELPSSRWYSGSGIYRNVDLVVTDPVHVARYGTYVTTPDLETEYAQDRAKVHMETEVENETDEEQTVKVNTTIYDDEGNVFHETETTEEAQIAAGETETFIQDITTVKPELWNTENPNLYSIKTEVVVEEQVVDTYDTTLGFRWITMDANEGFFLNGQYMKLHGMCMHHDQGALGSVANYRAIERQMESLMEMGVNAIRVTHNPAADELLEICNKKGLLVIDEAFDCWESPKRSKDYARFFNKAATHPDAKPGQTWAEFDIKTMVDRGKNEPCIMMWSIGNEIVGASKETAQKLVDWVAEVDATRPATQGFNNFIGGFGDERMKQVADVTGVVGFNYGENSYDAAHAEYPNWLIMGSETSSAVRSRGYYYIDHEKKIRSNYDDGNTVGWGRSAEAAWKADRDRKFVMGQFVWTGYDYIGEPSPYHDQWPAKSSYFGVFDTAGIPKDAFYIYQSQWVSAEEKPMVHLLPHWNWENDDTIKTDGNIKVQAYSNAASVELILNGDSLGKKQFLQKETSDGRPYQEAEDGHIYLEWQVPYKAGKLEAVARDLEGKEIARDVIETTGEPAKVKLTPDRQVITADGEDLSYITVDILDAEGRVVPTANNRVNFRISGNGKIVGVDNGDATEVEDSYKGNTREAYSGKAMVIVQSTEEEGSFTLSAASSGLESAKTTVFTTRSLGEKKLAGYESFDNITTEKGVKPELPEKAVAVYSDGSKEEKSVTWDEIDEERLQTPGMFTLSGRVEETQDEVTISVIVSDIISIREVNLITDIGAVPKLPGTVDVVYNTGVEKHMDVAWNEVTEDMLQEEGIVSVEGTVEGLTKKAKANIHVAQGETVYAKDIAKRNGTYPIPEASWVQSNGNDPVRVINDGKIYYNGGPSDGRWTAWGHKAEHEWIQLEFEETHNIGKVGIDLWSNERDPQMGISDRMVIEYSQNGTDWTPVENQSIGVKDDFIKDGENIFEFTPVDAKFIRWNFYSEARLSPGVSEVHVYEGNLQLPVSSDALLKDLKVNGQTIEGFNPEKTDYTIELDYEDDVPVLTAEAAEYASMVIVPALDGDSAAVISVVAEDGTTRMNYTVQFKRALPTLDNAVIHVDSMEITQDDIVDIMVEAFLQDGSKVGNDVIDVHFELGNMDIAEIKEQQIYALYPGKTTLKAVVTYQDKTVESNVLNLTIKENPNPTEITGYEEIEITTEKNVIPTLPEKVRATFKDGLPKQVPVIWDTITKEQCAEYGEFKVRGTVAGQKLKPEATILVKGVTGVQQFSTATPLGVVPKLPEKARLYYSDNTVDEAPIEWEAHPQELFMEDGALVTVNGKAKETATEHTYDVQITIRVSKDSRKGDKFTGYKNGFYWPLGIASFTNGMGSSQDSAAELNDNIVSRVEGDNNRWTNWASNWRESDWAGIIFGLEEVTYKFIDHLEIDFYTDHGAVVPKEIEVQYYDGEYFNEAPKDANNVTAEHPAGNDENWKPVKNPKLPETISATETAVITFDPVETCAIRVVMKAEQNKCIAITEMASYEKIVDKSSDIHVENILVDGKALEGFAADKTEYVIKTETMPKLTVETAGNESVTVMMPGRFGESAQIIVTAEDGVQTKTYSVTIEKELPEDLAEAIRQAKEAAAQAEAARTAAEKALEDARSEAAKAAAKAEEAKTEAANAIAKAEEAKKKAEAAESAKVKAEEAARQAAENAGATEEDRQAAEAAKEAAEAARDAAKAVQKEAETAKAAAETAKEAAQTAQSEAVKAQKKAVDAQGKAEAAKEAAEEAKEAAAQSEANALEAKKKAEAAKEAAEAAQTAAQADAEEAKKANEEAGKAKDMAEAAAKEAEIAQQLAEAQAKVADKAADESKAYAEKAEAAKKAAEEAAKRAEEERKKAEEELKKVKEESEKKLAEMRKLLEEARKLRLQSCLDFKAGSWYEDYVTDVYLRGYMTGMDTDYFGINETLVRAQFAVILYRMAGEPEVEFKDNFADVKDGQFYSDAVAWASEEGIITGYEDSGLFGPNDRITREQMATIMYRYAGVEEKKEKDKDTEEVLKAFPDAEKVSEFAKEALAWCVEEGIITGKTVGDEQVLEPQGNTLRAECAAIISRFAAWKEAK